MSCPRGSVVSFLTIFSLRNAMEIYRGKPQRKERRSVLDQAQLRSGDVVPATVPRQRNVVAHRIVVAFNIGRGKFYLNCLGKIGTHTEPAASEHGNGDSKLRAKEQNKLRCESAHYGIQAGNSVEGVCCGVGQVDQVERHSDNGSSEHEHGRAAVGAGCGLNALECGPHPEADSKHNEELQAVSDLVQVFVYNAARVAWCSSVCGHADARSVAKMSSSQDNLFGPTLRGCWENDVAAQLN